MLRHALAACLLIAASLSAPDVAWAQTGETAPVDAGAEASKAMPVQPIPVDQIAVMAERAKRGLADVGDRLADRDEIIAAELALPERAQAVSDLLAHSGQVREQGANLMILDQLRHEWRVLGTQLDEDQAVLGDKAARISRMRDRLTRDIEIWSETGVAAVAAIEDRDVIRLIDATVADLETMRDAAKKEQGSLASLQGRIARLSEEAAADANTLTDLRRELVGRIFTRDQPQVWAAAFYAHLSSDDLVARLDEHRKREEAAFFRFVDQYREHIIVQIALTLVLIPIMFTVRRRVRRIEGDEDAVAHMKAVFEGPTSLALLLAYFVGFWTYEYFPPLASAVLGLTFLLPAVLVLRRLLEPSFFPILYALLVLFVVDLMIEAVAPLPGLPRLIFILEMCTVTALAGWWRRPKRIAEIPLRVKTTVAFKGIGVGLNVAMFAAPAAIVADLCGFGALGNLVGGIVLSAGYAGVILYGSARAIDGLVAWLLMVRPLRLSGMVQRHRALIEKNVLTVAHWGIAGLFVFVILRRLEIADRVWAGLVVFWSFEIPFISVGISMGSIIEFMVVVRATFAVSKFVNFALDEEVYTRARLAKGQPYAISTLTRYAVLTLGFLLAVFALGVDLNRFTILAGAFGVGIGFGLQTIVNNFVSGIILLTEQPVQVGDTVELAGVYGEVQRIGIRSSAVRTWQGAEVIVPNAQLIAEQVTNWTLSDARRRFEIPVGVAYGTDPPRVQGILLQVASEHPEVSTDPAPMALFLNFGDSALEFELRCWTDQGTQFMRVRSDLVVAIERALREADITIPFPQRDVHLRSVEPSAE